MHAIVHAVCRQQRVQPGGQVLAAEIGLEVQCFHALEQALQVPFEKQHRMALDTQTFPHAIAQDKPRVEHRNTRLGTRHNRAIDLDEDSFIARIARVLMRAFHTCAPGTVFCARYCALFGPQVHPW